MMTRRSDDTATDVSLILKVGRSPTDQAAWAQFVDRYGPKILAWSRGWGLQRADAEDVAQAVLVKLARQMGRFSYDPSQSFRGWLHRVARNAWRDWASRRDRPLVEGQGGESALLSVEAGEDLIRRLEANFDLEVFEQAEHRACARVEARTWEAYRLMARDGLPPPEVAERLGMSVAWVFKAKSNVLKMIRQEAGILEGGPPEAREIEEIVT